MCHALTGRGPSRPPQVLLVLGVAYGCGNGTRRGARRRPAPLCSRARRRRLAGVFLSVDYALACDVRPSPLRPSCRPPTPRALRLRGVRRTRHKRSRLEPAAGAPFLGELRPVARRLGRLGEIEPRCRSLAEMCRDVAEMCGRPPDRKSARLPPLPSPRLCLRARPSSARRLTFTSPGPNPDPDPDPNPDPLGLPRLDARPSRRGAAPHVLRADGHGGPLLAPRARGHPHPLSPLQSSRRSPRAGAALHRYVVVMLSGAVYVAFAALLLRNVREKSRRRGDAASGLLRSSDSSPSSPEEGGE